MRNKDGFENSYVVLVNGKHRVLNEAEHQAEKKFHLSRFPFAWVNGELIFNNNHNDSRDHNHWLREEYNISDEEFKNINRGYMIEGRIQLFKDSTFEKLNIDEVEKDFSKLIDVYIKKYPESDSVKICNGVKIGKIGDIWEPIDIVKEINMK